MGDPGATYLCAIYDTLVILGRISGHNLKRAGFLVERLQGPDGELLDRWQTGTQEELQATFPEILSPQVFEDADDTYRRDKRLQIEFERPDLEQ